MASSIYMSSDAAVADCDPCNIIHKQVTEASFHCQECNENMCSKCLTHHRNVTLTTNHNVSNIDISATVNSMQVSGRLNQGIQNIKLDKKASKKQVPGSPAMFSKATLTEQFNTALDDDEEASDIRNALVSGNSLYIADTQNNKVKVFNYTSKEYICQVSVPANPFDVTEMADGRIAVSVLGKPIYFLALTGRNVSIVGTIQSYGIGLCYYNDLLYVVVSPKIHVYTTKGVLKRRIEPTSQGSLILSSVKYIAINPQTGNIYVTDWVKGVVGFTQEGNVIFVTHPTYLKNAVGVAIDDQGQVYACGSNSHNIIKMSHDGTGVMEIVSNVPECHSPERIRIYGNTMMLCCRDTSSIRIFTLS